ncbi:Aminopeptidase N [Sinobacterium norvegicum]|uniref:Aminopeptidase N n=1 Tax=Sinobacterium norvegicum TaxID=1641715 RepID=A0ABN8EJB6_9GAMM|nr:aminopeptidase N [Sinobacterium norvegicum]CAH0992510.1 Aminopeptidase N [Sinobacterium norvegicum]
MENAQPGTIYLKDYQQPNYWISETHLRFELADSDTVVRSRLSMQRRDGVAEGAELVLHGVELTLLSLLVNGVDVDQSQYSVDEQTLTIRGLPAQFELECVTQIQPQDNTSLEGLYQSRTMFCTQCEAEGFRKITYYLDRPDVMSVFTTTVVADKAKYPLLLSNGNPVDRGDLADGQHFVTWQDPFKKPAYLFAVVAADLALVEDSFTTMSGREVSLQLFVEPKDLDKCDHAMLSLKNAMRWDETTYGREYDLGIYMIVAVDDFNMGAMENKGLNIFNTSCVLAEQKTTTDAAFQRVEGVVAHEYFHNWSGNRVTCRDWFQLSLKEGFTVYRDAEFSADMNSPTVKRVEEVQLLRSAQFAEDAGPMAHPIRPASFIEISNFYTLTIYEKGAEVVRMIANLLGEDLFRQGTDLYFDRFDGQAVTTDDFVACMAEVSGQDFSQFQHWYDQAGTPQLDVSGEYNAADKTYTLSVSQSCPATPGQADKPVFLIPMATALVGRDGLLPLTLNGVDCGEETVLAVDQQSQQFVFENVTEAPVPSLLRNFSAPVKLRFDYSREQLLMLAARDNDGFCRWDAMQQLAVQIINEQAVAWRQGEAISVDSSLLTAIRALLGDAEANDKAMVAMMMSLPSLAYLIELSQQADIEALQAAREKVRLAIAVELQSLLLDCYHSNVSTDEYRPDATQIAQRSLKNACLSYLSLLPDQSAIELLQQQYQQADNMTDTMAALSAMVNSDGPNAASAKQDMLDDFYHRWQQEALVVNQWLQVQAGCGLAGGLDRVKALMQHPAFDIKNPNKVRSVVAVFCAQNAINFHHSDGSGYQFLAEQVIRLNELNPQIAARIITPLTKWRRFAPAQADNMQAALKQIMAAPNLSSDVYEVVSKSLT